MPVLSAIERLRDRSRPDDRFAAFRDLLGLPPEVELFYAFGSSSPASDQETPRTPGRLLLDARTQMWWQDYSGDPTYRLKCPVRRVVRNGFRPVLWRDLEPSVEAGHPDAQPWRRVRDLGIRDGVTVPIHDAARGAYGAVGIVSFGPRREFDDWYRSAGEALPAQVYYFHHGLEVEVPEGVEQARPALTRRERQCLTMVAAGACSKEIARRLDLSPRTVDLHVARGCRRLGARNRIEAVSIALKRGLIDV